MEIFSPSSSGVYLGGFVGYKSTSSSSIYISDSSYSNANDLEGVSCYTSTNSSYG